MCLMSNRPLNFHGASSTGSAHKCKLEATKYGAHMPACCSFEQRCSHHGSPACSSPHRMQPKRGVVSTTARECDLLLIESSDLFADTRPYSVLCRCCTRLHRSCDAAAEHVRCQVSRANGTISCTVLKPSSFCRVIHPGALKLLNIRKQSACARSKDWRESLRRDRLLGSRRLCSTLRLSQSFSHLLLSQLPKASSSAPLTRAFCVWFFARLMARRP